MKNLASVTSLAMLSLSLAACVSGGGNQTSSSSSSDSSEGAQIFVSVLEPGDTVTSPLTVTGEARGTWYFEASFPVRLLDGNGNEIAVEPAQAQEDWMTEDFVPFEVTLVFTQPSTPTGTLVLEKDNPSGLPEHADQITMPVSFQ